MTQENKLVAEFQKNENEITRVSLTQYRKKDYFDIRVYYKDDNDQWQPTKKGLCLAVGLFPEFKKAILALEEALGNGDEIYNRNHARKSTETYKDHGKKGYTKGKARKLVRSI